MRITGKAKKANDPRFIVDDEKELFIVTNYKCGFATLNHALNLNPEVTSTRNIGSLGELRNPAKYRKVLFCRNPYDRFLSFYVNWVVNKSPQRTPEKTRAFDLLKKSAPAPIWNLFCEASREEKMTSKFIELYTDHIANAVMQERHIHPQYLIYHRGGQTVDFFDEVLPVTENTRLIEEWYGIKAKVQNTTDSSEKASGLVTSEIRNFCNTIYARDFVDLGFERRPR